MMVLKSSTVMILERFLNDDPKGLKGSKRILFQGSKRFLLQGSESFLLQGSKRFLLQGSNKYPIKLVKQTVEEYSLHRIKKLKEFTKYFKSGLIRFPYITIIR